MAEVVQTEEFASWLKALRDPLGRRAILRRLARIVSTDHFGDHAGVGIGRLAREAGMSRQALHKALGEDGNPTLDTVLKVLKALGLHMRIEERPAKAA